MKSTIIRADIQANRANIMLSFFLDWLQQRNTGNPIRVSPLIIMKAATDLTPESEAKREEREEV